MKIIKQSTKWLFQDEVQNIRNQIAYGFRTCYHSHDKASEEADVNLLKKCVSENESLIKHESPLEHAVMHFEWITSRSVTHELVRHRIGSSFSQESQRYVNYSNERHGGEISIILPVHFYSLLDRLDDINNRLSSMFETLGDDIIPSVNIIHGNLKLLEIDNDLINDFCYWLYTQVVSESTYKLLLKNQKPEEARDVLTNACATKIYTTMNIRELRHFFNLRTGTAAHPAIKELATSMLYDLKEGLPELFSDIGDENLGILKTSYGDLNLT